VKTYRNKESFTQIMRQNMGENNLMKKTLTDNELFDYLVSEASKKFEGWDFSYLESTGRVQEFPLSWNYRNEVTIRLLEASSLLDMGTGGGEFLSSL